MSKLLINEPPLQVLPSLAVKIGLNEAIVLQQIHFWVSVNSGVIVDGDRWIYNTVQQWQDQFPFWSENTIARSLKSLRDQGLVIAKMLSESKWDKTLYYRVDYQKLISIESKNRYKDNDVIDSTNLVTSDSINLMESTNPDCDNLLTENTTQNQPKNRPESINATAIVKTKGESANELLNSVDTDLRKEWLEIRKAKKQITPTQRAMKVIQAEAEKVGLTLDQAIEVCCDHGWASFKARWHTNANQTSGAITVAQAQAMKQQTKADAIREANAKAMAEFLGETPKRNNDAIDTDFKEI